METSTLSSSDFDRQPYTTLLGESKTETLDPAEVGQENVSGLLDPDRAWSAWKASGGRSQTSKHALVKALDGMTYKEGTSVPDKSLGLDHLPDALGYLLWSEFSLLRDAPSIRPFRLI
jgi:hypothetical protein